MHKKGGFSKKTYNIALRNLLYSTKQKKKAMDSFRRHAYDNMPIVRRFYGQLIKSIIISPLLHQNDIQKQRSGIITILNGLINDKQTPLLIKKRRLFSLNRVPIVDMVFHLHSSIGVIQYGNKKIVKNHNIQAHPTSIGTMIYTKKGEPLILLKIKYQKKAKKTLIQFSRKYEMTHVLKEKIRKNKNIMFQTQVQNYKKTLSIILAHNGKYLTDYTASKVAGFNKQGDRRFKQVIQLSKLKKDSAIHNQPKSIYTLPDWVQTSWQLMELLKEKDLHYEPNDIIYWSQMNHLRIEPDPSKKKKKKQVYIKRRRLKNKKKEMLRKKRKNRSD